MSSAVEKRDVEELITINPTWKLVIDQDQIELLPKLHAPPEAPSGQLMLETQRGTGLLMIEDKRDPETDALQTARQESEKWN